MKKNKNNLDEMQEQKLLNFEKNGFWIAFWGLFLGIYIQLAMGNGSIEYIGCEAVVLLIISIYLLVNTIRNGIWDRKLKPNLKTNIIISLVAGLAFGVFWFVVSYSNYHALAGSIATFVLMFISVSVTVFAMLSLLVAAYNREKKKLDEQADEDEENE